MQIFDQLEYIIRPRALFASPLHQPIYYMLAETICGNVTDAIERRIEADFGEYKIVTAPVDKRGQTGNRLCLEIAERVSMDDDKWAAPFATIEVECERIGLCKYESVVYAHMSLDEPAGDLGRLSIEQDILKRHRAMEPEVIMTTRQGVSRVVAPLVGGGESEVGQIFVHRRLNISFKIARMTMGLSNMLANGPKEAFDDLGKIASEGIRALREIHEIVSTSKKPGK